MPLPHAVARLNKRWTNRFIEPVVSRSRRFAAIHHSGRRSGRAHRTPVVVFQTDTPSELLVALTYGPTADWFRNVQAGRGSVEQRNHTRPIIGVQVVGRTRAWPHLPWPVRGALRVLRVHDFAWLDMGG